MAGAGFRIFGIHSQLMVSASLLLLPPPPFTATVTSEYNSDAKETRNYFCEDFLVARGEGDGVKIGNKLERGVEGEITNDTFMSPFLFSGRVEAHFTPCISYFLTSLILASLLESSEPF